MKKYGSGIYLVAVAVIAVIAFSSQYHPTSANAARPEPALMPGQARATFAAGCFWSMQAIFEQLKGVDFVEPGYAGGTTQNPSYEDVETGNTGHAESIDITYNPNVISYSELLKVLLLARDPTTLNSQGPDSGTQYRSVIFYRDAQQKALAEKAVQEVTAEHVWSDPIVTAIEPYKNFYDAEGYHFDYYKNHPYEPYCAGVIAPEIDNFRSKFKAFLKS